MQHYWDSKWYISKDSTDIICSERDCVMSICEIETELAIHICKCHNDYIKNRKVHKSKE